MASFGIAMIGVAAVVVAGILLKAGRDNAAAAEWLVIVALLSAVSACAAVVR